MRSLVYVVATSMNGFIADAAGDTSCFPAEPETLAALFGHYPEMCPAHLREALGVTAAPRRFDTVLMGRHTFEPALTAGMPEGTYPHLRQIVVTHDELAVETLSGDVPDQVAALKEEPGEDIWLCGGGHLAGQLAGLIDEVQLKVNPVALKTGTPLFDGMAGTLDLSLATVEPWPGCVVLLTYRASSA